MKAIPVMILRNAAFSSRSSSCTMRDFTHAYMVHPEGYVEVANDAPELVGFVRVTVHGKDYSYLEPLNARPQVFSAGPFFGGDYVYAADRRFPSDHPLPLYDKFCART